LPSRSFAAGDETPLRDHVAAARCRRLDTPALARAARTRTPRELDERECSDARRETAHHQALREKNPLRSTVALAPRIELNSASHHVHSRR
jgi:hypothetical protein